MKLPPILFSFAFLQRSERLNYVAQRTMQKTEVMYDSGAYSAHHSGDTVRLDEYTRFALARQDHPNVWGCIQLDVLGDSQRTAENLAYAYRHGARVMPVVTTDMDPARIADLAAINPRVCIAGGRGSFTGVRSWFSNRLAALHATAPDAQLHALGYIRFPEIMREPLASVDSSACVNGQKYGDARWFDPSRGFVMFNMRGKVPTWARAAMERCGVSPAMFKLHARRTLSVPYIVTLYSAMIMSHWLRAQRGLRVFQVVANVPHLTDYIAVALHSTPTRCDIPAALGLARRWMELPAAQRVEAAFEAAEEL